MAFLFFHLPLRMPNPYFRFKQFTVMQDKCAMKVCTDSCLFGAWIPLHDRHRQILDVGTGTGLLSLMLSQRSEVLIDAIEIDAAAAEQASENFRNSPWGNRISLIHGDIRNFQSAKTYDLIISNPPFYESQQSSGDRGRNLAMHASHLSLDALLATAVGMLSETGNLALLLPYYRAGELENTAARYALHLEKELCFRQSEKHPLFRYAAFLGRKPMAQRHSEEISIKTADGHYSSAALALLSPYYLFL